MPADFVALWHVALLCNFVILWLCMLHFPSVNMMLTCKEIRAGSLVCFHHTHASQAAQCESWGGLWTATDADSLAANAVHLYTCEDEWQMCQERGFELLEALYSKAHRLKVVQVLTYIYVCRTMRQLC